MKIKMLPTSLEIREDALTQEEWKAVTNYSTPNIWVDCRDGYIKIIGKPQHIYTFLYVMTTKFHIELQ